MMERTLRKARYFQQGRNQRIKCVQGKIGNRPYTFLTCSSLKSDPETSFWNSGNAHAFMEVVASVIANVVALATTKKEITQLSGIYRSPYNVVQRGWLVSG